MKLITRRLLAMVMVGTSTLLPVVALYPDASQNRTGLPGRPLLIAHRGASASAPEHTLAAYRLAVEQGADFVEQDLQMTKDGELVCLHDPDLKRTTNVMDLYPDRATMRDPESAGAPRKGWYAIDFTLAEIKKLDAGAWFNRANPFAAREAYVGLRVPTLEEAIDAVGDRAGLYIEVKNYGFYRSLGCDIVGKLTAALEAHGFDKPRGRERVFIQSFWKEALLQLREIAGGYPRIQLLPMEGEARPEESSSRVSAELAKRIASYARGVGPSKTMINSMKDVAVFHAAGLLVHPYTFRGPTTAAARRPLEERLSNGVSVRDSVLAEIRRFLDFGIDGGFTDYPDLWRESASR